MAPFHTDVGGLELALCIAQTLDGALCLHEQGALQLLNAYTHHLLKLAGGGLEVTGPGDAASGNAQGAGPNGSFRPPPSFLNAGWTSQSSAQQQQQMASAGGAVRQLSLHYGRHGVSIEIFWLRKRWIS